MSGDRNCRPGSRNFAKKTRRLEVEILLKFASDFCFRAGKKKIFEGERIRFCFSGGGFGCGKRTRHYGEHADRVRRLDRIAKWDHAELCDVRARGTSCSTSSGDYTRAVLQDTLIAMEIHCV